MKINPYIFCLLMLIGLIVVVMPAIPHHHHSDSMICMKNDITADDCCSSHHTPHHHPYDDPCCPDACHTQIIKAEFASQQEELSDAFVIQETILFATLLSELLSQPGYVAPYRDYVYIESLHGTFVPCAASPRAPPRLFTI